MLKVKYICKGGVCRDGVRVLLLSCFACLPASCSPLADAIPRCSCAAGDNPTGFLNELRRLPPPHTHFPCVGRAPAPLEVSPNPNDLSPSGLRRSPSPKPDTEHHQGPGPDPHRTLTHFRRCCSYVCVCVCFGY